MKDRFAILITDLHLNEDPKDQYRFDLFEWIVRKYGDGRCQTLFILGDLTDKKDNHSAWFVNKIVSHLHFLTQSFDIYLLRGNHDCIDPRSPFFKFTQYMQKITYITEPRKLFPIYHGHQFRFLMLPHSRQPETEWKKLEFIKSDAIFMHQTFKGALAENDTVLDGLSPAKFDKYRAKIFSGDIHVPQKIGRITYIGAPYHIHFGDRFTPRILIANKDFKCQEDYFPAPRKHAIRIRNEQELLKADNFRKGDWIKVEVLLPRSEFVDWVGIRDRVKSTCKDLGLELHGLKLKEIKRTHLTKNDSEKKQISQREPEEIFARYCSKQKLDKYTKAIGNELLTVEYADALS